MLLAILLEKISNTGSIWKTLLIFFKTTVFHINLSIFHFFKKQKNKIIFLLVFSFTILVLEWLKKSSFGSSVL